MKIAFYTYDLFPGREYLMPWRTLLEVATVMKREGREVVVLNACYDESVRQDYEWKRVQIKALKIGFNVLADELTAMVADVVFVPFTWRDGLKDLSAFKKVNCKKVAYMAGGVYDLKSVWALFKAGGKMLVKPYFVESLIPKYKFTKAIKAVGFDSVIGLTELTAKYAKDAGFKKSVTIYPGNDSFRDIKPDDTLLEKYGLNGKRWMLFSGAPIIYRGASTLLKAVDEAKDDSLRVVFLMRQDPGRQYLQFFDGIKNVKHKERFLVIQEKCTREQLRAFFGEAWYALLPFLVIPSEIPLTYFELLSCGTPVITFQNGGTTLYLKKSLFIADKSVKGLVKALEQGWRDEGLRAELSKAGLGIMNGHPSWKQVAKQWIKLI